MPTSPSLEELPPLISPAQLSGFCGVPEQTLAVWRSTKRVPLPFVKLGSLVRYRRDDVRVWLEDNRVDPQATTRKARG